MSPPLCNRSRVDATGETVYVFVLISLYEILSISSQHATGVEPNVRRIVQEGSELDIEFPASNNSISDDCIARPVRHDDIDAFEGAFVVAVVIALRIPDENAGT